MRPRCAECQGWVEIAADYEKRLTAALQNESVLFTTLRLLVEAVQSGNATAIALASGCADHVLGKVAAPEISDETMGGMIRLSMMGGDGQMATAGRELKKLLAARARGLRRRDDPETP